MKRIRSLFTWFILAFTVASISYNCWQVVRPIRTADYYTAVHETDKAEYAAGEQVFISADFCKHGDYKAVVYPQLVGETVVTMPPFVSDIAAGCYEGLLVGFGFVPAHTPQGEYKLRWVIEYRINPLRTITHIRETHEFHVNSKQAVYFL